MQEGHQTDLASWRPLHLWLAIGFLTIAIAGITPTLSARTSAATLAVYSFDIPAQPLPDALRQFAQQSRQEILFTPGLVAGKRSQGIAGMLPALRALAALLEGTGLTWSTTPAGAILLHESSTPLHAAKTAGGDERTNVIADASAMHRTDVAHRTARKVRVPATYPSYIPENPITASF